MNLKKIANCYDAEIVMYNCNCFIISRTYHPSFVCVLFYFAVWLWKL